MTTVTTCDLCGKAITDAPHISGISCIEIKVGFSATNIELPDDVSHACLNCRTQILEVATKAIAELPILKDKVAGTEPDYDLKS